jgi:hypothetical protein
MSRDGGFDIGDRSTRTLYDTQLIRAYRLAGPEIVIAWDAIVDESWAKGQRVAIEDALLPLPYQMDIAAVKEALISVGLLDAEGRIRQQSWDTWFVPAEERRSTKRERDREYAKRAIHKRWDNESSSDRQRVASESVTDRIPPTVRPSDRPSNAREGDTLEGSPSARSKYDIPRPPTPIDATGRMLSLKEAIEMSVAKHIP